MKNIKKNKHLGSSLDDILKEELKDEEFKILYEKELFLNLIADEISSARKEVGITQKELAEKIGTTQSVLARLESVKNTRTPSLDLLHRIAIALNMKLFVEFCRN